ncbi:MAG: nicotinate (nicotinamide) nucleotide adenylyltransferase, partial [Clostridia bacterium]|nr:nicotinate (nicotinamide) nucleotide adenylyltransferase [Clostridia bacterium]
MKIGLLGGTFNPVHNGHLSLANQLISLGLLDKVLFVVSARPPHKDAPDVSDETRLLMVKLALSHEKNIEACDIELKREGKSYTVDTVAEISELYPGHDIYFITGADMFTDIPFWYQPEKLF